MAIAFAENYSHVQIRNRRQLYMISAGENGLPKQDIDNNWGCPEVPVSGVFSKERYKLLVVSSTPRSGLFALGQYDIDRVCYPPSLTTDRGIFRNSTGNVRFYCDISRQKEEKFAYIKKK